MKKSFRETVRSAVFFAVSCAAIAAVLAGCKANLAQSIVDAIDPPAHQLKLFYQDNAYAEDSVVTMQKTYAATGDAESFTLTNTSDTDVSLINVSSSDAVHFAVSGLSSSPTDVASGKSAAFTLSYLSTADGTNSSTITVAYKAAGKPRSFSVIVKATRTTNVSEVSLIEVRDDGNNQLTSNNAPAFDFGYSSSLIDKVFVIKNSGLKDLVISDAISSSSADFSIETKPVGTLAANASAVMKIRRTDGRVGKSATISIVSNASNASIFKLNVSSKDFESGSITVKDPSNAVLASGSAYDLGYSTAVIDRQLTITNTGLGELVIYSVTSDNPSISVSSKPANNFALAENASVSFTLSLPSAAAASTANITVATSDSHTPSYVLKASGGGSLLNISHSGTVTYKMNNTGYDFGYVAPNASNSKSITLTNCGLSPITITEAGMTGSSAFTVMTYPLTAIAAGGSGTLTIGYAPGAASTTWSEATCTLKDSRGRSYSIYLHGSSFKQPQDTGLTPALWLRADRIGPSDIVTIDSSAKVNAWQDVSGHGLVANPAVYNSDKLRPSYTASNSNLKGFPSIFFSGMNYKDELQIYVPGGFINTSQGTTTFIAFRTYSTVDGSRFLLHCFYTNNTTEVFPRLMWDARYFDTGDGLWNTTPSPVFPAVPAGAVSNPITTPVNYSCALATYGNTNQTLRYFCDSNWNNPSLIVSKTYVAALKYSVNADTTKPNMWAWLNNAPDNESTLNSKPLGFLYSNNNTYVDVAAGNAAYPSGRYYFGAYGLPVGDGCGNMNPALNGAGYSNDYALYLKSTVANGKHAYFYNWLDSQYNTHIGGLYIGANSSATQNFWGDIAEIIMYDTPLSADNIKIVSNYLMAKYGASAMTP